MTAATNRQRLHVGRDSTRGMRGESVLDTAKRRFSSRSKVAAKQASLLWGFSPSPRMELMIPALATFGWIKLDDAFDDWYELWFLAFVSTTLMWSLPLPIGVEITRRGERTGQ